LPTGAPAGGTITVSGSDIVMRGTLLTGFFVEDLTGFAFGLDFLFFTAHMDATPGTVVPSGVPASVDGIR
jgi:hypothetical protein